MLISIYRFTTFFTRCIVSWSLEKSRSRAIGCYNDCIALNLEMHLGREIGKVLTRISRLRDFTRYCGKTSARSEKRCAGSSHFCPRRKWNQCLYSVSRKSSYQPVSLSLGDVRFDVNRRVAPKHYYKNVCTISERSDNPMCVRARVCVRVCASPNGSISGSVGCRPQAINRSNDFTHGPISYTIFYLYALYFRNCAFFITRFQKFTRLHSMV